MTRAILALTGAAILIAFGVLCLELGRSMQAHGCKCCVCQPPCPCAPK